MSIKKIAEMAGVSISTVSRVLNDPNHKCTDNTVAEKIFEAARQLNYVPNENARGLKHNSSSNERIYYINILVTRNESDPFFSELLRLAEVYACNNMFVIKHIWHNCLFSDFKKCKYSDLHRIINDMCSSEEKASDGLIVLGKIYKGAIDELRNHFKNIVSVSRNYENLEVDEIICDGNKNTGIAVEHLISLGHKKIAYVGNAENESRYEGYLKTLFQFGIMQNIRYVYECAATFQDGIDAFEHFRKMSDPPTGVYCSNDIIALGMIKALGRYNKKWYYSPSIVSSDDIDEAQYSSPMLTTVHLPKDEMIRFAYIMLKDKINGSHSSAVKMEFGGKLIIRGSTRNADQSFECEYII